MPHLQVDPLRACQMGRRAVHAAVITGQAHVLPFLHECGVDMQAESAGGNPLSIAEYLGKTDVLRTLRGLLRK